MKKSFLIVMFLMAVISAQAVISVSPWQPIFKGIAQAVGTNTPDASIPRLQVAHCVRVDLSDPDVQLFSTPPAPNAVLGRAETLTLTVSNFLKINNLAVAVDANFYDGNQGGSDPPAEGILADVHGLQVCTGLVVSAVATDRAASLLFTTNKEVIVAFDNRPPGISTDGIFTAITGFYPIVSNGVSVAAAAAISYPDSSIHQPQPRTIYGVSADRRYLFLMTIDGRQAGYSDGAIDQESATWILQFGAQDAINMDGGGSTSMYMADCGGFPLPIGHSSYVAAYGRERYVGSHFGVSAQPLPGDGAVQNVSIDAATTTVTVLWDTPFPATSQVEYGSTAGYGSSTPPSLLPVTRHAVTVTGLTASTSYYYRVVSKAGAETFSDGCRFTTTGSSAVTKLLFDVTKPWKWMNNNLDGVAWTSPAYDDSSWNGPGPGLLYVEESALVDPKNTPMENGGLPYAGLGTHYFRTHFNFEGPIDGVSLVFSNFLDDAAVFFLNGVEIQRMFLPNAPAPIVYSTFASATGCSGDATCPLLFSVSGARLKQGDNVLAIEVHNRNGSQDLVFGTALFAIADAPEVPSLNEFSADNVVTLWWNGSGYTLQETDHLDPVSTLWTDASGAATISPYIINQPASEKFYRLRH